MFEASKFEVIVMIKKMLAKKLIPTLFSGYENLSLHTKAQDDLQIITRIDQQTLNQLMMLYIRNEIGLTMYTKMMLYINRNINELVGVDIFVPLIIMLTDFKKNRLFQKSTEIQLISNCSENTLENITGLGFEDSSVACLDKIKPLIGKKTMSSEEKQDLKQSQEIKKGAIMIRVKESYQFEVQENASNLKLSEILKQAIDTQKIMFTEFQKRFETILPDLKIKKYPKQPQTHLRQLNIQYRTFEQFNFDHKSSTNMFQFNLKCQKLQLKCHYEHSEYLSDSSQQDLLVFENKANKFSDELRKSMNKYIPNFSCPEQHRSMIDTQIITEKFQAFSQQIDFSQKIDEEDEKQQEQISSSVKRTYLLKDLWCDKIFNEIKPELVLRDMRGNQSFVNEDTLINAGRELESMKTFGMETQTLWKDMNVENSQSCAKQQISQKNIKISQDDTCLNTQIEENDLIKLQDNRNYQQNLPLEISNQRGPKNAVQQQQTLESILGPKSLLPEKIHIPQLQIQNFCIADILIPKNQTNLQKTGQFEEFKKAWKEACWPFM
eukprot:403365420